MSLRQCSSLQSTQRIINLCTLKVAKKQWRHGRPFATFMRRKACKTFCSFATNFFTCKMQECSGLLNHMNMVKALGDQFVCLEASVRSGDCVLTLLKNLPPSYKHLIAASWIVLMKELTMKYMMTCLMHEMSKGKEKESKVMIS